MMTPILGASGLGRCGRSTQASTLDLSSSSSSSRRHSSSSQARKSSHTSSLMDDWSDAFTGIVDLDRRMRQLAMSEQGLEPLDSSTQLDVYEPYSPLSPSRLESLQHVHSRRKSSTDARSGSISQPSLTTGRSFPSFTSHPTNTTASSSSTTATWRFSQDSRAHSSSLLAKRRSSATSTIDSFDSTHSPIRLAPLPASPSAFGNYRLTDSTSLPRTRLMLPATCWSSLDEQDPLTPLAIPSSQLDPITPTTAAAATWTDPTAPSYFPAGLSDLSNKKKPRLLRKKAARPPLPSLVSAQVVSSPTAESGLVGDDRDRLQVAVTLPANMGKDESGRAYTLRRSAQSLALSFRFKMLRAKRKVKRSGQGAVDLFAAAASQTSSGEATSISI
ncbi:hypothetical protein NDA14_001392 [Ustilago hordei]|nr:hypothetical protein NDA10_001991 [Ustilago hordei]KAJ1583906.1 hypothetical protein NDA15_007843 [Ustilago hordei]KAJ1592127.1 hypothetical protein NDA12_005834 [Ustilago hordei]KAJ1602843.1 hypothetical protein NDA14_001392 [Ustilago hordei]UTT95020.1 hypothetical protein NDA17_003649 [Ustilago hordei]